LTLFDIFSPQTTFEYEEDSAHTFTITWMKLPWQRVQLFPVTDQALYTQSDGNKCSNKFKRSENGTTGKEIM